MPYRDAWDLKPPGIYLLYALLASVASGARLMALLRVVDVAIAMATAELLAAFTRRLLGSGVQGLRASGVQGPAPESVGCMAAAWYAALYFHESFWGLAQAETWANPLVVGTALLCVGDPWDRRRCWGRWFGAGMLTGIAITLKFTAALPALPFLAFTVWRTERRMRAAALILTGAALPVLAVGLWLHAGGAWDAYLDVQRGFVVPYARLNAPSLGKRLANICGYSIGWAARAWMPVLLGLWGASRWRGSGHRMLLLALGGALASVWVQNKFFGYHWQAIFPMLVVFAAVGTAEALASLRVSVRVAAGTGVAAAIVWVLAVQGSYYRDAVLTAAGVMPRSAWLNHFGRYGRGDMSFLADHEVAAYVAAHTAPGDGILVWGFEPSVYLLAGRRPGTRFFFNVPVTVRFGPQPWRREYLTDVRVRPPELVLVLSHDAIPWANGRTDDSAAQLQEWPALREWLRMNYRAETAIEHFSIYRKSAP